MTHRKEKLLFLLTMALILASLAVFVGFRMQKPRAVEADLTALGAALQEQNLSENTVPGSTLELKRRFGLLESDYSGVLYFAPVTYMNVEEILVVAIRSEEEGDRVEEAMNDALDAEKQLFKHYGVDQYGYLKSAVLYRNDGYVALAVGGKAEDVMREIRSAIER